jgi:hypothetical protein
MTNGRGEYGDVKFLQGGSLFSRAPYGGSPAPNDGGWAYRGARAFHGHEAPTYGRGGLWASKREAPLGRGGLDTRGQYGTQVSGLDWKKLGDHYAEISDAERHAAIDAANVAMAPLVEARQKLLLGWPTTAKLTPDQMTKIEQATVTLAHEAEKNLVELIDKVPAHWESYLTEPLAGLRKSLLDAPKFEPLVASWHLPMAVPGFRAWINHLLSQVEDAVGAMAAVSSIIPDWIRMRDLMSGLYAVTIGVLHGIVSGIIALTKGIPTAVKVAGVATLAVGALWAISKLTTQLTPAGAFSRSS